MKSQHRPSHHDQSMFSDHANNSDSDHSETDSVDSLDSLNPLEGLDALDSMINPALNGEGIFHRSKKREHTPKYKPNYVGVWLGPDEKQLWTDRAKEKNLSLSQFIRTCVDAFLFQNPNLSKSDQGLQDEVVLLRSSIKNLENKYNVDRTALLSQMAQKTMEDMPLEDKVVKHLTGRSLFLNQIANYCQVAPKDILSTLAHMRKKGMVDQDPQMRWHMKCIAK